MTADRVPFDSNTVDERAMQWGNKTTACGVVGPNGALWCKLTGLYILIARIYGGYGTCLLFGEMLSLAVQNGPTHPLAIKSWHLAVPASTSSLVPLLKCQAGRHCIRIRLKAGRRSG